MGWDPEEPERGTESDTRSGVTRPAVSARGQSVQLGAILLFAALILALGLFQTNVVPEQNEEVEFNAYQGAVSDMVELRTQVLRTAESGTVGGASIQTGAQYPARLLTLNPTAPTGTVRMTAGDSITIDNAIAVESDTAAHWDGSSRSFQSREVEFRPAYNRFEAPSVRVTGAVAYRTPADGDAIFETQQTLVRGNRLSVTTLRGDLGVSGEQVPLISEPTSASGQTIRVTGDGGDILVDIPSDLSVSAWQRLLSPELASNGGNVEDIQSTSDGVRLELDGSQTYELKLAEVEIRERADDGVVNEPTEAYVVKQRGDGETVVNTQTVDLTAQVRDGFNNPEPGAEVDFSIEQGSGSLSPGPVTQSGEAGLATVTFDPDDSYSGTAEIEATCTTCTGPGVSTTFTVQVSAGPESVQRPPSVEVRDVDKTNDVPDKYQVTAEVADPDGNLQQVNFYLLDPDTVDGPGSSIDDEDQSVSGSSGTATVTLDRSVDGTLSGDLDEYRILVRVTDSDGLKSTDSFTVSG